MFSLSTRRWPQVKIRLPGLQVFPYSTIEKRMTLCPPGILDPFSLKGTNWCPVSLRQFQHRFLARPQDGEMTGSPRFLMRRGPKRSHYGPPVPWKQPVLRERWSASAVFRSRRTAAPCTRCSLPVLTVLGSILISETTCGFMKLTAAVWRFT